MSKGPSTTIRIRSQDKAKLEALCRATRRNIVEMIGLLIAQESRKLQRKAG